MLYLILKISIISLLLIFLVHHLINFFKSTLTVPKIKDLVNNPTKKYENMYNIIKSQQGRGNNHNYTNDTNDINYTNDTNYTNGNDTNGNSNNFLNQEYTLIDLLPKKDEENMKTELKNFLKKQLTTPNNDINDINKINSSNQPDGINQLDGTNITSLDSMGNISFSNY